MSFKPAAIDHVVAKDKIRHFAEMPNIIRGLTKAGVTVVLAQGVFDIVHRGHVGYLRASRAVDPGNSVVIVGVENDESVRRNKGAQRPINSLADRLYMLAEFISVGLVFAYEDTPDYTQPSSYINRYKALGPAAVVVPTWDPHRNLKTWQAKQAGTQLALVDYRHVNSTSLLLKKLGYE